MLHQPLGAEVDACLERHEDRVCGGHALVMRNGTVRARRVTCGAGTLAVKAPRVNDRRADSRAAPARYESDPAPYMRRPPKVAEGLPVCTCGASPQDVREALTILLGEDAAGFVADEHRAADGSVGKPGSRVAAPDLADRDYVLVRVEGVHFNLRLEDERCCTLVMAGGRGRTGRRN